MSPVALVLAVLVLLSRIPLLTQDQPVRMREVIRAWGLQALGILLLLRPAWGRVGVVAAMFCLHVVWARAERRAPSLQKVRLVLLGASLLVVACAGSEGLGLTLRDWHPALRAVGRWCPPAGMLEHLPWRPVLVVSVGWLLAFQEANGFIRWVIEAMNLKPTLPEGPSQAAALEYQRGRLIGVLERLITFVLVLKGQWTALGFVLTAKSMARFKSLDEREFAEYFLLGTLLSVGVAAALAMVVAWALAA